VEGNDVDETCVVKSRAVRAVYIGGGCVCVALGAVGVVVPGMPTTVFVLAASYLFARACPGLERRLEQNRWLGPGLVRYRETGGMPLRAKKLAVVSMWSGIMLSMLVLASAPWLIRLAIVTAGAIGTVVVWFYVRTVAEAEARDA
jgi:uncharacterized membrane protein YbaN (DUF454 family)